MVRDYLVEVTQGTLAVRESGVPEGVPVLHFHGTPGSRFELAWADDVVASAGVHLITFDRPGYGRSTQFPFSLSSLAALAIELADRLGWQDFVTLGWSGGGPFALATAAAAPRRISSVGVISGAGPFQEMPGALEQLTGGDADGAGLVSSDPAAAAAAFAGTFSDLTKLSSVADMLTALEPALSARDRRVLAEPHIASAFLSDFQEAFRQGSLGGGWDNVSWIGPWDFATDSVRCPVHLWYGDEDQMAPAEVGQWLAQHLPNAQLTVRRGYGHLAAIEHLPEMLDEVVASHSGSASS